MKFEHSGDGLSSRHLFFGADFIVYTEGSSSGDDGNNQGSADIIFWQKVFSMFLPSTKIHVSPLGSKRELLPIALDIKNGTVDRVIVCMDRDHDDVNGKMILSDRVLYTFGYSWENDACHSKAVRETLFSICARCRMKDSWMGDELECHITGFLKSVYWHVRAEVLLGPQDTYVFPRTRNGRKISGQYFVAMKPVPRFDRSKLSSGLSVINADRNRTLPLADKRGHPLHDCWGHLVADYCTSVLRYMLKKYCGVKTVENHLMLTRIIDSFEKAVNSCSEMRKHYLDVFERVIQPATEATT